MTAHRPHHFHSNLQPGRTICVRPAASELDGSFQACLHANSLLKSTNEAQLTLLHVTCPRPCLHPDCRSRSVACLAVCVWPQACAAACAVSMQAWGALLPAPKVQVQNCFSFAPPCVQPVHSAGHQ